MTDPDERIINRAINYLDKTTVENTQQGDLQDIREEARAALHRLFRDRRRLEGNYQRQVEVVQELEAELARLRYELSVADYPGKNELVRELARLRAMKGVGPDHEVVELGTLHRLVTENARLRECCADHSSCEASADAHMDELRANLYQAQRQVKDSEADRG